MSSTAGLEGVDGLAGSATATPGVIGLTGSAALDYADRGLRVNAVGPGPILTDRLSAAGPEAQREVAAVPMGRIGRAEEDARTVVWLCSDQARFVTGTVVTVDGGRRAGHAPYREFARAAGADQPGQMIHQGQSGGGQVG